MTSQPGTTVDSCNTQSKGNQTTSKIMQKLFFEHLDIASYIFFFRVIYSYI